MALGRHPAPALCETAHFSATRPTQKGDDRPRQGLALIAYKRKSLFECPLATFRTWPHTYRSSPTAPDRSGQAGCLLVTDSSTAPRRGKVLRRQGHLPLGRATRSRPETLPHMPMELRQAGVEVASGQPRRATGSTDGAPQRTRRTSRPDRRSPAVGPGPGRRCRQPSCPSPAPPGGRSRP